MLYNKAIGATASAQKIYIEDAFSTYLYTGNGSTQTITNGIDLSGKGGLVWIKSRAANRGNSLFDTARGASKLLCSNQATSQDGDFGGVAQTDTLTSFNSNGFSLGADTAYAWVNSVSGSAYASWTFRKAAKFFDVVTWSGDGSSSRSIAHSLGTTPGFIVVKRTSSTSDWWCWHRSISTGNLSGNNLIVLNSTAAQTNIGTVLGTASSTTFQVGGDSSVNANGGTYVAYLFAHDAGGFGDSGNDNVISCGSYTGNGSTSGPTVTLGWEPQWLLVKNTTGSADDWDIFDNLRGVTTNGGDQRLRANVASAEDTGTDFITFNATGFQPATTISDVNANGSTYIYIAIRRGPMKTPTDATNVFQAKVYTGTNVDNRLVTTDILTDMVWARQRNDSVLAGMVVGDRLRGQPYLLTGSTAAEVNDADSFDQQIVSAVEYGTAFSSMSGFYVGNDATSKLNANTTSNNHVVHAFRRAPGFFDVVAYTGTGSVRTVAHNLGVVPELIITKPRNFADGWGVYAAPLAATKRLRLDLTNAESTTSAYWNNTNPTSSVFTVGADNATNGNTYTYIAYLFATCPGVSKVGSYTGTGNSTFNVNCGFTTGARFVLIKRTDSSGDWYLWDSARGLTVFNAPYLLLNSTATEVTGTTYINSISTGFGVSAGLPEIPVNFTGASYIYLAVA